MVPWYRLVLQSKSESRLQHGGAVVVRVVAVSVVGVVGVAVWVAAVVVEDSFEYVHVYDEGRRVMRQASL